MSFYFGLRMMIYIIEIIKMWGRKGKGDSRLFVEVGLVFDLD